MPRRLLIISIAAMLLASGISADDYIKLGSDSLIGNIENEIPFYMLRECPTPPYMLGFANGFVMTDNGSGITWEWNQYPTPGPWFESWQLGFMITPLNLDGVSPDTFLDTTFQ